MKPRPEAEAAIPLSQLHRHLSDRLASAGVAQARLDMRLLLQAVLGLDHAAFLASPDRPVAPDEVQRIDGLVARRLAGEPVSRILGVREFYGRRFMITSDVLDPRPETELLVETALAVLKARPAGETTRLLDLGTGSGILALTLLKECPGLMTVATDISPAALEVARGNAVQLGVDDRLNLVQSNWYGHVTGPFHLIVSNPPYIVSDDIAGLAREVRDNDPRLALDGGGDGLDAYRAIARGAVAHLEPGGHIAVEIGRDQAQAVCRLFAECGLVAVQGGGVGRDLAGLDRVVHMMWRG